MLPEYCIVHDYQALFVSSFVPRYQIQITESSPLVLSGYTHLDLGCHSLARPLAFQFLPFQNEVKFLWILGRTRPVPELLLFPDCLIASQVRTAAHLGFCQSRRHPVLGRHAIFRVSAELLEKTTAHRVLVLEHSSPAQEHPYFYRAKVFFRFRTRTLTSPRLLVYCFC